MKGRIFILLAAMLLGTVALWNVRAENPHGPSVVATVSTSVSSSVGTTTLYTPASDGDYELKVYIIAPPGGSNLHLYVNWTDEFVNHQFSNNVLTGNQDTTFTYGSSMTSFPIVLHLKGGDNITYRWDYTASPSPVSFDVFLTLVKE